MLEYLRYAIDEDPTKELPEDVTISVKTGDPIADEWDKSLNETGTFAALNPEDVKTVMPFIEENSR